MTYLELFWAFLQISSLSVGGGYAMVPLITRLVSEHGWMTSEQIADALAISQMTPGPFYLNTAILVGMHNAGIPGSLVSIAGVLIPSLVIVIIVARYFYNFYQKPLVRSILTGVRPAVVGMVAGAAVLLSRDSLFHSQNWPAILISITAFFANIEYISVVIIVVSLFCLIKLKAHPLLMLGISAVIGLIAYLLGYRA